MIKRMISLFILSVMIVGISAVNVNVKVKGVLKDKLSKEPLIGATIRVMGSHTGAVTDMEGHFELSGLLEGMYDLELKYVGYKTGVHRKVRVEKGKLVLLNLELEADAQELSTVTVVAKKNRESETMLLLEQQKAVIAIQSVGAKELSRKGIGDAEGAVTKLSGISKQEGVKNVFVRGLGDRYNATTFNGFPVPSEAPEYKNISLDFFSTDMIQSIGVNKAFSAIGSGDVGGATMDIASKELVGDGTVQLNLSAGLNTQTLTADFLQQTGVNAFGFANRQLPSADESIYSFGNRLDPTEQHLQVNQSYSASGGRRFQLREGKDALSFYLVAGHNTDYQYTEETLRSTTTTGVIYKDLLGKKSAQNISQLALANVDYSIAERHRLSYNFMMIHNSVQSVADYEGMDSRDFNDDYDNLGFIRRQQTNDNLLLVHQLLTRWNLTQALNFEVGASYNKVKGLEPDRRMNVLRKAATNYILLEGNSQFRYFSTLNEDDINTRAIFTYRLADGTDERSNVKLGYTGRLVDDNFEATEYNMTSAHSSDFRLEEFSLDDYYNAQNMANGWFKLQRNIDKYTVKKNIHSLYAEVNYPFLHRWTINAGVKYDYVDIAVDYDVDKGNTKGTGNIRKNYYLPSLNLKYDLNPKSAFRLSLSQTYTLPQAKEISPYRYVGVNFDSQGNQKLKPSDNYNVDLKWDFNPTATELLSLTLFYKHIKNPISRIEVNSAGGYLSYENIAPHATAAGVELELRKNLFIRPVARSGVSKLSLGLNGSYIYTCADMPLATVSTGSQLEGAAPWIVNADLSHTFSQGNRSFVNTLVFNYVSDKIYTIGTQGYQDIMEHGIGSLDFVSSVRFNKLLALNLKVRNLLNPAHQLTRAANEGGEKVTLSNYRKGINISLGASCTF